MYLFLAATGLSVLSVFHSRIVEFILNLFFPFKSANGPIKDEIKSLKMELQEVSMVDEFPKYARLQRKLNALKEQLSTESPSKTSFIMNRMLMRVFLQINFVCTSIFCFYMYRSVSVVTLPVEWLQPNPLPSIINWPSGKPGGVSFFVWFSVASQVFRIVKS